MKLKILHPLLATSLALVGCIGNSGNSLNPPQDVTAVAGDGIAGVTWTPQPAVLYLAIGSTNPDVTAQNWTDATVNGFAIINRGAQETFPPAIGCNNYSTGAQAPYAAINGLPYYYLVTAHTGTAPGGPESNVVRVFPRAAGGEFHDPNDPANVNHSTWGPTLGAAMSVNGSAPTINGVGYGAVTACLSSGLPSGIFAAVGNGGAIFSSTDGSNWTYRTPVGFTNDLYAVASYTLALNNTAAPNLLMVAVGAGGATIRSSDGVNWGTSVASGASPNLRAITWTGTVFVAVGDAGTIRTSPDGVTWTNWTTSGGTSANLHGIYCAGNSCVAVGDAGTVISGAIYASNSQLWTQSVVGTANLRAVVYGNFDNNWDTSTNPAQLGVGGTYPTSINTWVVVGDNGTAYQSTSAGVWNAVPISGAANLVAIGYTTQFVALDASGNAYTSQLANGNNQLPVGVGTWSAPVASGILDPVGMTTNAHGFILVGSSGDNVGSF